MQHHWSAIVQQSHTYTMNDKLKMQPNVNCQTTTETAAGSVEMVLYHTQINNPTSEVNSIILEYRICILYTSDVMRQCLWQVKNHLAKSEQKPRAMCLKNKSKPVKCFHLLQRSLMCKTKFDVCCMHREPCQKIAIYDEPSMDSQVRHACSQNDFAHGWNEVSLRHKINCHKQNIIR